MHLPFSQENWLDSQVTFLQPFSSEKSPQSLSVSHLKEAGMHLKGVG